MKTQQIATRAVVGLLPALVLTATPATAQDAVPIAPPIASAPVQPAPPPVATTPYVSATPTGVTASDRAKYEASLAAATGADAPIGDEPVQVPAASRIHSRSASRSIAVPAAVAPAAVASPAVVPREAAPAPLPKNTAESGSAESVIASAPVADAPTTADSRATTTTTTPSATPAWAWLIGALAIVALAAVGSFALRRRRSDAEIREETPVAQDVPVPASDDAAAPLAAPLVPETIEHAEVTTPAAEDVAAITEAVAPVAGRPWIELALRPLRAGADDEAATVDLELTLANAGGVEARDVRVSTFMLGDAADAPTEMERLLTVGHAGTEVDAGAIAAGEGSRIDATLAVPRADMSGATFQPIVVADVRYALPGGGEGRTAAAFAVGVADDDAELMPLRLGGDMREDVGAALHGVPERV